MSRDSTTTETTTQRADPTTLAREGLMWDQALGLANTPYQAYGGQRISGFTPDQLAGFDAVRASMGSGAAPIQTGIDYATRAGGYSPMMVDPAQAALAPGVSVDPVVAERARAAQAGPTALAGGVDSYFEAARRAGTGAGARDVSSQDALMRLSQYINPHTDSVVNAALADQERARQTAIASGQGAATAAGAFGGSRHGVADSLTNEAAIRAAGALSGQLRSDGFNTALGVASSDANRALAAAQGNQSADVATSIANAGNAASLFGTQAGLAAGTNQFNANAQNNTEQFNAGLLTGTSQFNAGQGNAVATGNANRDASLGTFNAGQENALNTFNAGQANAVAQGNQQAGLQGNAQTLAAGSALGALGGAQQARDLTAADAILKSGGAQQGLNQAKLDVNYANWLDQVNDPYNKLGFLQGFRGTAGQDTMRSLTEEGSALGGLLGAASTIAGGPLGPIIGSAGASLLGIGGGGGGGVQAPPYTPQVQRTTFDPFYLTPRF